MNPGRQWDFLGETHRLGAIRSVFTGEHTHSLDKQGRVAVPAEMREVLQETYGDEALMVTKALHGKCLWAFPMAEWKSLTARMTEKVIGSEKTMRMRRKFITPARKCEVDKAGRILLPDPLREHAGLDKDVTFASQGRYLELWRPDEWVKTVAEDDANDADLLDVAADL